MNIYTGDSLTICRAKQLLNLTVTLKSQNMSECVPDSGIDSIPYFFQLLFNNGTVYHFSIRSQYNNMGVGLCALWTPAYIGLYVQKCLCH